MTDKELARKAELAERMLEAARQLGESLEPERVYERFHLLLGDVVPHDGLVVSTYEAFPSAVTVPIATRGSRATWSTRRRSRRSR